MYYIRDGLRCSGNRSAVCGAVFAVLCGVNALVTGTVVQANAAACIFPERYRLTCGFLLALALCYVCGTAWYCFAFGGSFWAVAAMCVVPYLLPDGLKFAIALLLSRRLKKYA
jgi:biotin transporter BioY